MTSLKYKYLGMPSNEKEFQDMLAKKHVETIDITMVMYEGLKVKSLGPIASPLREYTCYPVLCANGIKLSLSAGSRTHHLINDERRLPLDELVIQEKVFSEIMDMASSYKKQGFNVTLGKLPFEEAKNSILTYFKCEKNRYASN